MRIISRIISAFTSWFKPTPPPTPTPLPDDQNEALLLLHNQQRIANHVSPLTLNKLLGAAAQKHAEWMHTKDILSHIGVHGSDFVERAKIEGYRMRTGGENIAKGQTNIQEAMDDWMASKSHRENILSLDYREVGFGRSGDYWCTVFAAPLSQFLIQPECLVSVPDPITKFNSETYVR